MLKEVAGTEKYARPYLTSQFEIVDREYDPPNNYEYSVRFSNHSTAIVAVYEKWGRIESADIVMSNRSKDKGSRD